MEQARRPEPTLLVRQARGVAGGPVLERVANASLDGAELRAWSTRLSWPGAVVLWLGEVSPAASEPAAAAVLFTDGARAGLVAVGEASQPPADGLSERLAREALEVARAAGCRALDVSRAVAEELGDDALRRLGCTAGGPDGSWAAEL
jgi:hypothetical protein